MLQSSRAAAPPCAAAFVVLSFAAFACDDEGVSPEDTEQIVALELSSSAMPLSTTNAYADRPDAAELGRKLFFDKRLSSDGTVACVDCHKPELGFSDDRQLSEGVGGQLGKRHSMPITTAALQRFLLWDGRADSVWRQPLLALENEREMDFTRTDVALFVASQIRSDYEAVFGPIPDLEGVPPHVRPGDAGWESLTADKRDAVQRIFVNVGKALEAYERAVVCKETRLDQWLRGDIELSDRELAGARSFARSGCLGCHNGPALSDGKFHNLGLVREDDAEIDTGREASVPDLLADELNSAGVYSDDPQAGAERLSDATGESRTRGAFRTASLRGVTQRPRFGHRGVHTDLEEFIQDTYNRGRGGRRGDGDGDGDGADIVGTLDPLLDEVDVDGGDADRIIDFLRTTECPELPAELLAPPQP